MSAVTSKLTGDQERRICAMFGHARLGLIYKASIHGYQWSDFMNKCKRQGPTLTVAYNNSGFIFGGYVSKDYAQTGENIIDDKAFLFSFDEKEQRPSAYRVSSQPGQYSYTDGNTGPNFGSLQFMHKNRANIYSNPDSFFKFEPMRMHGNNLQLIECEVYRVEESSALLQKPWRSVKWNPESRKGLMDNIIKWKPAINSVNQARLLLVGPVGAGKSSFFNSVCSVFKGHVRIQANTGTAGTSLTTQFRTYSIRGCNEKPLPIVLCDTMGMENSLNAGLHIEDFISILKGNVPDRYQFNASMPIQEKTLGFRKSVSEKDKIHCVVYVIDASKVKLLPDQMIEEFAAYRRKANSLGVPQVVLLTKVDMACPLVAENLTNVYCSKKLEGLMHHIAGELGLSMSAVIPVKSYSKEFELDPNVDILLLNAVIQMLRMAESYFDDLTDNEEKTD